MKFTGCYLAAQLVTAVLAVNYNLTRRASCGDKVCDQTSETCFNCPGDCGTCHIPYIQRCTQPGHVSLTFDDGPSDNSGALLDIANKLGVKLTLFVIGQKLSSPNYQQAIKNYYEAGHVIASHTFTHPYLTKLSDEQIRQEMIKADDAIFNVIGVRPKFMRNPYSDKDERVDALLQSMGYKSIFTSLDTKDTEFGEAGSNKILPTVIEALNKADSKRDSFVITQHETLNGSIHNLPAIVDQLRSHGYDLPLVHSCIGETNPYR